MTIFEKAFVGVVENSGLTYSMQEMFHFEGYFSVKVTPMGANLCLLEDLVDWELKALIEGGSRKIINVISGPKSDDLETKMSTRDSEEEDRDVYIEVGKYDEDKLDNKIDVICEEVNGDKALVVLDRADDS